MPEITWNPLKNERLKKTRGVSFEEVLQAELIVFIKHPGIPHQSLMLFWHNHYVWAVPYVETENGMFLKTVYRSRKFTKMHKRGEL